MGKIIRSDSWSSADDQTLTNIVLTHIKEGLTRLDGFEQAGDQLSRTSAACAFRWNTVLKPSKQTEIKEANRQRLARIRELKGRSRALNEKVNI